MIEGDDIRLAVKRLGLSGKPICVHAALSSFGWVKDGANTIVEAMLAEGSTILTPAATWDYFAVRPQDHQLYECNGGSVAEWRAYFATRRNPFPGTDQIYRPDSLKIDKAMGAISAAVVAHPNRIRGEHPLFSFAAIGPVANRLVGTQLPTDVFAPLRVLLEEEGAIVLMGVDLTKATFLHYAEEVAGRTPFRRWANNAHGEPMTVTVGGCSDGFEQFASYLTAIEKRVHVGRSLWRVFPARDMLVNAVAAIQKNPSITRCSKPRCERCRDAILGGPLLV